LNSLRSKIFLFITLGLLIFIGLSFYADVGNIVRSFEAFKWFYLPVILLLAFLNYLLRFVKWDYYLLHIDIKLSKNASFTVFMSGLAMSVTPGKVGEFLKAYLVKELNGTPISHSAPIVVAERFTDFIAIVILSTYGVFLFQYGAHALLVSTMLVLVFLCVVSCHTLFFKIIHCLHNVPFVNKISLRIEAAYQSAQRLMAPKPLMLATLISVGAWFCECYAFYFVFKGLNVSSFLSQAIFVYAFSTLIGAVSMLPGGLGATEGSMTGLLILLEIPKHTAVAATIIIRICTLWFAVFVGILALILGKKSFIKRSIASGKKSIIKNDRTHNI
jgi:uncharacterized protein (TIRG00374 family)